MNGTLVFLISDKKGTSKLTKMAILRKKGTLGSQWQSLINSRNWKLYKICFVPFQRGGGGVMDNECSKSWLLVLETNECLSWNHVGRLWHSTHDPCSEPGRGCVCWRYFLWGKKLGRDYVKREKERKWGRIFGSKKQKSRGKNVFAVSVFIHCKA